MDGIEEVCSQSLNRGRREANAGKPQSLGGYYRTPYFLRRFLGALTFKGVCQSHPTKSSEIKYWIPDWASNYNVQLWLERNVCGTPSFGLKLQRKVPWGGEDTILRFSFLGDTDGIKNVLQSGRGTLDDVDQNHSRTPLHVSKPKAVSGIPPYLS